ncbi:rhodanese-like domain-containing protein [Ilumatobacter sp.]|uniref:rhodanese-like domain-containing protein n=1 Tax=Ilumatobacter sp. TaxID=1967498 RepID=UPI003AF7680A
MAVGPAVDPSTLADWLVDGDELAVLDAREQGVFLTGHLFHAACVPLSHLELQLPNLVPRHDTRIVWCDDGDGDLAERGRARSLELGWTNVAVLDGGTTAWSASGRELYAGVNVPSKAFGEHVEHTYGTPRLPAAEVRALLDGEADVVVLDSRPIEEFRRMSIPTGIDCPGAELVHRVKQVVTDPDTLVVVNCAGRTRSIIGSQSLINAGIENRVVALENGTMGWELAGFDVDHGRDDHAPDPSPPARAWAERAAAEVGRRFGVRRIDHRVLDTWLADGDRTTALLDVRTPDEYEIGHLPNSVSAPGGQLVQATDEYIATRNARLVLVDDTGVRATMTASWLRQMGWNDAVVLERALQDRPLESGRPARRSVGRAPTISVSELAATLDADADPAAIAVLDLGTSLKYRDKGHVPGAWWGVRSRLDQAHLVIGDVHTLVLTSTDGQLAKLAVTDARREWPDATVVALAGGNKGWRHAGHEMEPGFTRPTTEADDVWYKPYDHEGDVVRQHMEDYLTWEIALVEQLERDPTVAFPTFD